jgi:hypothetical protein
MQGDTRRTAATRHTFVVRSARREHLCETRRDIRDLIVGRGDEQKVCVGKRVELSGSERERLRRESACGAPGMFLAARDESDYRVTALTERKRERRAESPRADDGDARLL